MSNYDSPEVKKKTAPTMFIELVDQRDSGWVLDGTRGTKNEVRLTTPSAEFIPNRGYRLVKVKDENGKDQWINEPIRYIKNCSFLSVEEQNKRGYRPAKNKMEDLILVKGKNNGARGGNYLAVTREGSHIGLFDFLKCVFYNESNPNAPASAKKLFREVDFDKKSEAFNELEVAQAEATMYIASLYGKRGKEYEYNETKINSLCNIFTVYADSPAGKINGLIAHAKADPVGFLNRALIVEQTVEAEIGEALELNVIKFDKNIAVYCHRDEVVLDLGRGNLKHEIKVKKLGELFGNDEHLGAYEKFRAELEAARQHNK